MPPGTLVYTGERTRDDKVTLSVFDYDANHLNEIPFDSVDACLSRCETPTVTWINVEGLHDVGVIERIGKGYGIHPLALEDVLTTQERPKIEDYDDRIFLVVQMLSWDDGSQSIATEQVSFVLGPHFLITFQEPAGDVFDPVRKRLREGRGRMRRLGPDYLLYALLDSIVDSYFTILERLDDRIESLETELTDIPGPTTVHAIHSLRREMILLRRNVWPLREVLGGLDRGDSTLVQAETRLFLRDVRDHSIQVIETVETFRDLLTGMLDIYLSTLNYRMNAVMKVLTIIATIFIPLSFVTGIYGMNFEHMPELHWRWGYPAALAGMFGVGGVMLWVFHRRDWL